MKPLKMLKTLKTLLKTGLLLTASTVRLLLGNYMKISDSKYICYFLKLYCTIFAICLTTWHFLFNYAPILVNVSTFEYCCFVVYYLITSQKYLIKFRNGICTSDVVMGYKNLPYINSFVYKFVGFTFTIRFGLIILHWNPSLASASYIMRISNDANYMVVWFLLYTLYTRIVLIRKCLRNNFVPINIVGKDQVNKNVNILRKCMGYYNNLLDNMRIIDRPLQISLSLSLLCSVPKFVAGIYYAIKLWVLEDSPLNIFLRTLELIFFVVMVTLPAFIAEMISNEINDIKSTLVTQLIQCSDQSLRFELEIALQYIHDIRPFSFVICRAVPLNINLPFGLLSICISYAIVVMQFSHFRES